MFKSNRTVIFIFILLLILFILGVVRLFELRFEKGDIYPAYSSLRSDPLGTKVLLESLKITPPLTPSRNYQPVYRIESGRNTTLFSLGMNTMVFDYIDRETYNAISNFVASGGRLVISFFPLKPSAQKENNKSSKEKLHDQTTESEESKPVRQDSGEEETETKDIGQREDTAESNEDRIDRHRKNFISLQKHWGFQFNYAGARRDGITASLSAERKNINLPPSLSHHTTLYFDHLSDAWKVIYTSHNQPVIIEREIGKGSIVLSADSYLFSNEAMLMERQTNLLSWFIGRNHHVLFDELHFGIQKRMGFSGLVRRYSLHTFFAGLFLIALLFIWKNAVTLVPPLESNVRSEGNTLMDSKDYASGLVSLLRRNIPEKDLLKIGFDEWLKSLGPGKKRLKEKINKIESVVTGGDSETGRSSSVKKYKAICKILAERKG